jgi:hypothetical protein
MQRGRSAHYPVPPYRVEAGTEVPRPALSGGAGALPALRWTIGPDEPSRDAWTSGTKDAPALGEDREHGRGPGRQRRRRHSPHSKPDWNPDRLCSTDHSSTLAAFSVDLVSEAGLLADAASSRPDRNLLVQTPSRPSALPCWTRETWRSTSTMSLSVCGCWKRIPKALNAVHRALPP